MYILIAITGVSLADTSACCGLWSKLGGKKPVGKEVETSFVWKWLPLVQWYRICPYARHEAILGTKIITPMNLYFRIRWDWRASFMTRPLYPREIGTHTLLIRSLWEPHRWSGRVAGKKNFLPVLGFETQAFPCQAVSQSVYRKRYPGSKWNYFLWSIFTFVKKVCYFEPLWKKCYLNAFTGKYLRTFELCILEEYCLVIIWLCLMAVSLRSGDVVSCSNTRLASWHAACVFHDTHILVSCCHVATDRFSVHWIPWNV